LIVSTREIEVNKNGRWYAQVQSVDVEHSNSLLELEMVGSDEQYVVCCVRDLNEMQANAGKQMSSVFVAISMIQ